MSSKEVFSKFIPNVKLGTRFDADGNEIEVEIREDQQASECRKKIFDLLLSAGYFRVMIKTLTDFDKIVGGMTWAIEACDFDVDVDLLFHENLTIGNKISLVERIVAVLPFMKCPFTLEPHQIQGLDFINIYPVIQWLVKESVNLRAERSEKSKKFAVSEFHNHFKMITSDNSRQERQRALQNIREIDNLYSAKRIFKRKYNAEPEDEKSRVRLTLLEYGIKNLTRHLPRSDDGSASTFDRSMSGDDEEECDDEIDVERLVNDNLALAKEEFYHESNLTEEEQNEIARHYENLKIEMLTDVKQLSEQNKTKHLEAMSSALEKRLQRIIHENDELSNDIKRDCDELDYLSGVNDGIAGEIRRLEIQENKIDKSVRKDIKELILQNERMKLEEIEFKENCTRIIEELHRQIEEAEAIAATPDDSLDDNDELVDNESEKLRVCRLQLAKKNRAVISLQRQLDNIPDNTELAQYQKRFLELYNNMGVKYKETKQFFSLYNTLNEKHKYLEKEIALLNSIYDHHTQAMTTVHTKEQFLEKFEEIVEGVSMTKSKIHRKHDNERKTRDDFNAELLGLIELQRRYAAMIKQFQIACESNK